MTTDKDVKKMKAVFATKDNLKLIMDSLKAFATKNDLKVFATKEYVDKRFERLFKYLDHRFEPLDKLVKGFDELNNKISTNLDFLMGKYTKLDDEHIILAVQNKRINGKLDNHEVRIVSLEQKAISL